MFNKMSDYKDKINTVRSNKNNMSFDNNNNNLNNNSELNDDIDTKQLK